MAIGRRIISFFRRKKPMEKQLAGQFRKETKKIAAERNNVTTPLAKEQIAKEVKQRKQIGKGKTNGRITKIEE